ncbi:hypothetical protein [Kineococcus sp. SYSU DK003]|uniref:hypothetical protein n=1 Tax=Kineococcus sp. SYSU DK003 TaxID=3383124 RepID=UPI003D7DD604
MSGSYPLGAPFVGLTGFDLCHRQPLELAMASPAFDAEEQLDRWRSIIDVGRREGDFARTVQRIGGVPFASPPEGNSWERWAGWVAERLAELVDDPTSIAAVPQYPEHWQLRDGKLDDTVGPALRRRLSEIAVPAGRSRRDYLVVDVGEPVGVVLTRDEGGRSVGEQVTQRVGVVVERTDRPRVIGVHAAPAVDDPRADGWRAEWPRLSSAFGGWFSLGAFGNRTPATMQYSMLEREPDDLLEELAAEGRELLDLTDEDLRAAVVALGCYVEPSWLRLWLEWMFWRIGYFDWK